ncbi:MAG: hypothetical protein IIW94_03550 [Clostridia bacterium]|nr:hypothetical protein [Clostridia bacterium]
MSFKALKSKATVTVFVLFFVLICCLAPLTSSADTVSNVDDGFVNVEDFGALKDDNSDDYAAFEKAIATGKNIYVPAGKFILSKPIVIEDKIIRGANSGVSIIAANYEDKSLPIVTVKGKTTITDLYLCYFNTLISADEKQGERVALQIGDDKRGLEAGSVVRNLFIDVVGTAIYAPENSSCNGVLFDTIEVQFFSFRGVDMRCNNRVGNTYSNFYVNNQGRYTNGDASFVLTGSEYGPVLNQINIEHGPLLYGLLLENVKNFNIGAIHFEGMGISQDDMGILYANNSSGYIADLTYILNFIRCYNSSVIRCGNSQSNDVIRIGNINLRGVNQPDENLIKGQKGWLEELGSLSNRGLNTPQAKTFVVFERDKDASGDYQIVYENYAFYSYWQNEYDFWKSLPTRGDISVVKSTELGGTVK